MKAKKAQTIVSMKNRLGNKCENETVNQQVRQIFKHIAMLCENLDANGLNDEQASYIDFELSELHRTLSDSDREIEYLEAEHNFPYKTHDDSRYPVWILYSREINKILLFDESQYDSYCQDPDACLEGAKVFMTPPCFTQPSPYFYCNRFGVTYAMKDNILLCYKPALF